MQAWFPVHIKNGEIESVGKLRWRKRNRKCRYVEDSNCFRTGPPKRIYNAQEDKDDPDSGKGEDDGETAYDDYDYSDDEDDDDESSTSNGDSIEYETSVTVSKDIATDTVSGVSPITVEDQTLIIEDDLPPKFTTECPLTDETEEQTVRIVPGNFRSHCRNRYHTYKHQYSETATKSDIATKPGTVTKSDTATKSDVGSKFSEYNEQSVETTSNKSTTSIKIKYYTDAYDDEDTQKVTNEVEITKSTTEQLVSTKAGTHKVQPVTGKSEIYQYTVKQSSSGTSSIRLTVSEEPEIYSETKPERPDMLSSLKDSNTFSDSGTVSNQQKTSSVNISPTDVIPTMSKMNTFTKDRTKCVPKTTEIGDYCKEDMADVRKLE